MSEPKKGWSRRDFLKGVGTAGVLGAAGTGLMNWDRVPNAQSEPGNDKDDPRFLIVLCASGGASIIDSVMAIRASESNRASTLNTFPDKLVKSIPDSPFRAVDLQMNTLGPIPAKWRSDQSSFVKKHKDEMMVVTQSGTSVTHQIAQRRSVTGNEAWNGRTLQECVAMQYGKGHTLPNMLLATGTSFIENGNDPSIPSYALGETVANPAVWPLSLDSSRGISGIDPSLIRDMQTLRNEKIDPQSRFARLFRNNQMMKRWQTVRGTPQRLLENQDLITKLMLYPDSAKYPLKASGLKSSPAAQRVREVFPKFEVDPLEAQAALAFLLLKFRVSVSVTIGPRFDLVAHGDDNIFDKIRNGNSGGLPEGTILNPPIAFDFSHQGHRATQGMMWHRIYGIADGLIRLLKSEEFRKGESFWDRSMIYIATDFGRTRLRPSNSEDFGTAHDLNNGFVVLSPMVNGNKLLGGVDPNTAMTYGFDPTTGAPDKGKNMNERHIFSGLLHALKVDTSGSGLPDMRAMRKNA